MPKVDQLPQAPPHEHTQLRTHITVEKYHEDLTPEQIASGEYQPYEVVERDDNALLIGGASALWQQLIGSGAITAFSNANARLGVGDSTTAFADTQTALQAATNKVYVAMDATYPQHTDSTGTSGSKSITWKASFTGAVANYVWNEWCVSNGNPGRLLNRKVESLGTKASGTWALTITHTLA